MKTIPVILMLLVLMAACASTDSDRFDSTRMTYGGSFEARAVASHNK